jgi:Tfp pilus assembly protein PilF
MKASVVPLLAEHPSSNSRSGHSVFVAALLSAGMLAGSLLIAGCHSADPLPEKSSKTYSDFVAAFYVGLAALQVGDDVRAETSLAEATKLVAGEPAAWANWGILALRQRNFDAAAQRFDRAVSLDGRDDRLFYLQGLLESDRGNSTAAIGKLRQAIQTNPRNVRAIYQLASEVERQGDEHSEADFEQLIQQALVAQPDNLAAMVELSRIAAKRGDTATLRATLAKLQSRSAGWPAEVQQQLMTLQTAANGPDPKTAATRSIFLRNVLMRVPEFRTSLSQLKAQPGEEAQPFTHFLKLESPEFHPAPIDDGLTFNQQPIPTIPKGAWNWISAISFNGEGTPTVVVANGHTVQLAQGATLPFPGGKTATPPDSEGVLPIDFNYDFKTDLVLAGAGGLRFLRQESPQKFTDVSKETKLPPAVLNAAYTGAWAADIEADGDLDVVAGATAGPTTVLRNNGDGTFLPIHPFAGVSGVQQFVWADFNGDGNPDAAVMDGSGHLHVFINERSAKFREISVPAEAAQVKAITAADVNHGGALALLTVGSDGTIRSLSLPQESEQWKVARIADVPDTANHLKGAVGLRAADIDNNGAVDLMLTSAAKAPLIWMQGADGVFLASAKAAQAVGVMDLNDLRGDGRLDLLGITTDGQPSDFVNKGSKNYHWQTIRPRARQTTGDQRVNSFGIGGEIEIRSGLLLQKRAINAPELHFGLGFGPAVDVARIVWPNGSVRAEFALKPDQSVLTEQRLKGSCPFLFAYNGKQMEFVKDAVPWGSAIGLRINAVGSARVEATEEWYKIGRDQLVAKDGFYDLRITGELWETYYYDSLRLMAVDHPLGTEIFTDERFAVPAVKLAVTAVAEPQPIAHAVDDNGQDVTETLRSLDGKYLDTFGRGQYQGVTRDHYVEVDLGENVPASGPLWLIAKGWLHPSDSSINIALGQGNHEAPKTLSLEVPDGHGGWRIANANLGFPAGRKKICLFDLSNVFVPGTPHKLRLGTNLEVYWDSIEWAKGLPKTALKITQLAPKIADLHYRGYSIIHQENPSSPETPDYNRLASTTQIWRDLSGYYTRYGDVRELLAGADDRYVIMNAGDELGLRFAAPPPPPTGWVRDYIIAGDGWIKDGDYNSTNSQTVLPYPYHARKEYNSAPTKLEDEWVYKHHPEDWQNFQTRYVTPQIFTNALKDEEHR